MTHHTYIEKKDICCATNISWNDKMPTIITYNYHKRNVVANTLAIHLRLDVIPLHISQIHNYTLMNNKNNLPSKHFSGG